MANYYASARSNYFRVNDPEGLQESLPDGVELHTSSIEPDLVCMLVTCPDQGGWPTWVIDEDDNDVEFDYANALAPFLLDDEVVIMMEAGAEKLRYISGYARAFNNKGEEVVISLNDIYAKASSLGANVTPAEY